MGTTVETLDEIWSAYHGEENQVGKFSHIARLLGYKASEIDAFLDDAAEDEKEDEA